MTKTKSIFLSMLILSAVLFITCQVLPSAGNKKEGAKRGSPVLTVEGFVVKPTTVQESITISGTIKPIEETTLMSDVTGRVVSVNLPEGKFVKQGTLLVKLFSDDLSASLKKAEAQLELALQNEKRQSEMIKISGISQSEYDQSILQVQSQKADVDMLKAQIRKTEVRAPFDGVVGLKNISIGAQVNPQTPLATIRAMQKLKLDFSVPEKYTAAIGPGMHVQFSTGSSDSLYGATIIATERGVETATRNLRVRARIDSKTELLLPGRYALVTLKLAENQNTLMVPTQAIIPLERMKKVVVVRGGKANFKEVITGVRQASMVEVKSGISEGDTIATTGLLLLKPGSPVTIARIAR